MTEYTFKSKEIWDDINGNPSTLYKILMTEIYNNLSKIEDFYSSNLFLIEDLIVSHIFKLDNPLVN